MIFCLPPSLSGRGTKRCSQAKTGASSIDFRVSFAKEVLLGMALGDFFMLQIFGTPSLPAPGTKRTPQAVEPHVLTLFCPLLEIALGDNFML